MRGTGTISFYSNGATYPQRGTGQIPRKLNATILAAVGVGIAMANARPEAKAAASRVSRWTNDEDAVAKEIWSLLEEERARRPWWRVW